MNMKRIGLGVVCVLLSGLTACGLFYEERGKKGQACFSTGLCREGLSCQSGICTIGTLDGDTDEASCAANSKDCDGPWTRSCQSGEWIRMTDCSQNGKSCADGACVVVDGDTTEADSDSDAEESADNRENEIPEADRDKTENIDAESDTSEANENPETDGPDLTDNDADSDTEADTNDKDDTDPEPQEQETNDGETECAFGPYCKDGRWLSVGSPCLFGQDAFLCTRDTCDASHACSIHTLLADKCLISEVCYDKYQTRSGYPCLWCDPDRENGLWSGKPASESCDDGNTCTYGDHCDGNGSCANGSSLSCVSETDTCGARRACNGTSTCAVTYPDTAVDCNTEGLACVDAKCNGAGTCQQTRKEGSCLIDGICYLHHQTKPGTICQWCDSATNAWVDKPSTEGCNNDGDKCNGVNSCVNGSCMQTIGPVVCAPKDDCHTAGECEPATGLCSNPLKSDGSACGSGDQCLSGICMDCTDDNGCGDMPDDGNPCSVALCDTTQHTCVYDTTQRINMPCGSMNNTTCDKADLCDAAGVCQPNYTAATTSCNDANACTRNDACNGSGQCVGTSFSCGAYGTCNGTACDCNTYYTGDSCAYCTDSGKTYPSCKPDIIKVVAGTQHVCLLLANNAVECFGDNAYGQLGNGKNISSDTPQPVVGLQSGVSDIRAGATHTCALISNGSVRCWGANNSGQIGIGNSTGSYNTPQAITSLSGNVTAIATGLYHSCAISAGTALCWGQNNSGQCGQSGGYVQSVPSTVATLNSGVTAIAAGVRHSCAIVSGAVKCWGRGYYEYMPATITGLESGATLLEAGGDTSCAVISGTLKCWGDNANGELGNGTTAGSITTPVAVTGLTSGISALSAGFGHVCAIVSGAAKCWGNNGSGQLGDASMDNRLTPVAVSGLASGVIGIAAGQGATGVASTGTPGNNFSCAVLTTGRIKCWGGYSVSGVTPVLERLSPVATSGLGSITQLAAGGLHTCALESGAVNCWGLNSRGQLGDGTQTYRPTPVTVIASGATLIAKSHSRTCAIVSGAAKCWGKNDFGAIGNGSSVANQLLPDTVSGLTGAVTDIASGDNRSCAVVLGGVKCWGVTSQTGVSTFTNTPVDISGLSSGVSNVAVGSDHYCVLMNSGGVKCWGDNTYGQLGLGTTTAATTPTAVIGISAKVLAIKAARNTTCALLTGGGVKCWGQGASGQIGNGSNTDVSLPTDVSGITSGATAIAGGSDTFCAIVSGALKCWGSGAFGKLGNGQKTNSNVPIAVPGMQSKVTLADVGGTQTCAFVDGTSKCWGDNSYGQLGIGEMIYHITPYDIIPW